MGKDWNKVHKRASDAFVVPNSDPDDPDRELKWSDADDWTCPTWKGDVVPTDPGPWLKLLEGENPRTQQAILIKNVDAVCAVNPFSRCARLSNSAASIRKAIDDFVAQLGSADGKANSADTRAALSPGAKIMLNGPFTII